MTVQQDERPSVKSERPPKPEPSTRTGKLAVAVRRMPIVRQLIPMEAMLGWPIPVARRDGTAVKFPFVGMQHVRRDGVSAELFPPLASITLDWSTGRPVEYVDLRWQRPGGDLPWAGVAAQFPHEAVRGPIADYLAKKERLYALTDAVLEAASAGRGVPGAEVTEYRELLATLVEPGLLPYYRAIAPKFVAMIAGEQTP